MRCFYLIMVLITLVFCVFIVPASTQSQNTNSKLLTAFKPMIHDLSLYPDTFNTDPKDFQMMLFGDRVTTPSPIDFWITKGLFAPLLVYMGIDSINPSRRETSDVMKSIVLLFHLCILQSTSVVSLDTFLDCPGNDDIWGVLRRCCKSEELPKGCECFDISDKTDFTNTLFHKPECPSDLGVQFHLFTRNNVNDGVIVTALHGSLANSPFKGHRQTKFITHGFTDHGPAPWSIAMKNALLEEGDNNVIIVNWQKGAEGMNYHQAAANVRSVGAMLAKLIQVMKYKFGAVLGNVHLIGHSLGAHISGAAGKEIRRLESASVGRITGLDPAGPMFESYSANVRLDSQDASFVDIIHTDAELLISSGFGTRYSIGHVDFYPNGGKHQPGCPEESGGILSMLDFEEESATGACSHSRCLDFFTSSIRMCDYMPSNDDDRCRMGYHTSPACRGDHYPKTSGSPPYC